MVMLSGVDDHHRMDSTHGGETRERPTPNRALIDQLVVATPATRDRYIDALRAVAIVVVVLWHWVFSVTYWPPDGQIGMPNPLPSIPGAWVLTWFLQVMPLFFVVGGFANLAAYRSHPTGFVRRRMARLIRPTAVFVGSWIVIDGLRALCFPQTQSVLAWGFVTFVPMWFVGVYAVVTACVPVTVWLHDRLGLIAPLIYFVLIAGNDFLRFRMGIDAQALVMSLVVFVFAHQLGYFWRDGAFDSRRVAGWVAVGSALALFALTSVDPYIRSMVSLPGFSHMNPTTLCIAVLALFQLGVAQLLRPWATRALQRRRVWKAVVIVNARAMTTLVWHMTPWIALVLVVDVLGFDLVTTPNVHWWLGRPVWLVLPLLGLWPLLALFGRFEQIRRTGLTTVEPRGAGTLGA